MKRIKTIFCAAFMVFSVIGLSAETVSQKQASKIAETFFNAAYGQYMSSPKMVWNGRQLTTDRLFSPFYIYNHPKGGFVIISADTKAFPILGYSKTTRFDREKLTDSEKDLLKQYAHEIELIRYDSRQPERAIEAWRNLPFYINKVLNNPYNSPEFESLTDDAKNKLEEIDRRNSGVLMPSAVEFQIYNPENYREYTLNDVLADTEEIPFSFYEDFIKEIENEEQTRNAMFDEIISPTKPVVEILGGAHFTIRFPEEMKMAVVYSMQGLRLIERYYKNTAVINIDLSSLPGGFYAMLALGESGKVYGFKLFR